VNGVTNGVVLTYILMILAGLFVWSHCSLVYHDSHDASVSAGLLV